jgi:hypothetical protein
VAAAARHKLECVNSISALESCAAEHLQHYVDPTSKRAFGVYDRLGDANTFEPTDALAPALLDAPVSRTIVVDMFSVEESPFTKLRDAMQRLLTETQSPGPAFDGLDLEDPDGPWHLVKTVLLLSDNTSGLKASKVTKMLHRKRPKLVPIFDSKVAKFYGETALKPSPLWPKLQRELQEHYDQLADLADGVMTTDGRQISSLRVLDIVVWEHVVTSCGR